MSAFSFTAPYITEEEEKAERLSLSDAERLELDRDLFGKDDDADEPEETPDGNAHAVQQVHEVIAAMPDQQKQVYLEARERCLRVVETESDPIKFLRCCKFDAEAAAKRLVEYWKVRKTIFGENRAFLPMTLTGAMADDREALEKALVQVLPDDEHGRPVLFWDRIRSVKTVVTRDEVARAHFYMLHVMAQRESVQKNGYVWIVFLKGFDLYMHFDRILDKKLFKVMFSFPTTFRGIHTFTGSGQSVVGLTMPVLKHMGGRYYRLRLVLHAGSDKELLERLALYGVTGAHLGAYVGGRYNRERSEFLAWLEMERRNEAARIAAEQQNEADAEGEENADAPHHGAQPI